MKKLYCILLLLGCVIPIVGNLLSMEYDQEPIRKYIRTHKAFVSNSSNYDVEEATFHYTALRNEPWCKKHIIKEGNAIIKNPCRNLCILGAIGSISGGISALISYTITSLILQYLQS